MNIKNFLLGSHSFFDYLWDTGTPGSGFTIFGSTHLIVLGILTLIIASMCIFYKKQNNHTQHRIIQIIALVIFLLEIIKQITFPLLHSQYYISEIPLHLCAITIYLEIIYVFFPKTTTTIGEILYSLSLPGALTALIFPCWTMYPLNNFYCLHSFFVHTLHIAFILMLIISRHLHPKVTNLWRVVVFLIIIIPPIYLLNIHLKTNFFYVNAGSEGSPLELFINIFGNPGFLLPYIGSVLIVWLLMYLPWLIIDHKKGKNNEQTKIFTSIYQCEKQEETCC